MIKKQVGTRLLSSKTLKNYTMRKEELLFSDGSKEIRVGYYTHDGKYLGTLSDAKKYIETKERALKAPPADSSMNPKNPIKKGSKYLNG